MIAVWRYYFQISKSVDFLFFHLKVNVTFILTTVEFLLYRESKNTELELLLMLAVLLVICGQLRAKEKEEK